MATASWSSCNTVLWSFHTRRRSVWVNRCHQSNAACNLHVLPILNRCWGKRLGFCTFCWNRQQLYCKVIYFSKQRNKLTFGEAFYLQFAWLSSAPTTTWVCCWTWDLLLTFSTVTWCWTSHQQLWLKYFIFIKLQFYDIQMLDLEEYLLNYILLWNLKKFGSKYNTLEVYDWSVLHGMSLGAIELTWTACILAASVWASWYWSTG